jgi:hypothetical protein
MLQHSSLRPSPVPPFQVDTQIAHLQSQSRRKPLPNQDLRVVDAFLDVLFTCAAPSSDLAVLASLLDLDRKSPGRKELRHGSRRSHRERHRAGILVLVDTRAKIGLCRQPGIDLAR